MEGVRERQIFELGALRKPGQGIHDVLCLQEKVHPSERCAHGVTISSVSDVLFLSNCGISSQVPWTIPDTPID